MLEESVQQIMNHILILGHEYTFLLQPLHKDMQKGTGLDFLFKEKNCQARSSLSLFDLVKCVPSKDFQSPLKPLPGCGGRGVGVFCFPFRLSLFWFCRGVEENGTGHSWEYVVAIRL